MSMVDSFRDLRMRFEAPNEQNRWDYPLFKVAAIIDEGIVLEIFELHLSIALSLHVQCLFTLQTQLVINHAK